MINQETLIGNFWALSSVQRWEFRMERIKKYNKGVLANWNLSLEERLQLQTFFG